MLSSYRHASAFRIRCQKRNSLLLSFFHFVSVKLTSSICFLCISKAAFGVCPVLQGASAVQAPQFSSGYSRVPRELPIQTSLTLSETEPTRHGSAQVPDQDMLPSFINVDQPRSSWLWHGGIMGTRLIPLLYYRRSVDVLRSHLENKTKETHCRYVKRKHSEPVASFFFLQLIEFKLCFSRGGNLSERRLGTI